MLRTVFIAALVFFAGLAPAQAADPVKMMTNSWPPYVDKQLPDEGLAVELVTHIFALAGYSVENTVESWPRAMEGVRIGLYDVLGAAWRDQARDQDFQFSEPYLINELIVVKRRDLQGRYISIGDLQNSRIGLSPDYAYGVDFTELPGVQIKYENHIIQNLMNLLNKKVDFVVGDRRVIALQLEEYLKDRRHEIAVAPISLPPRPLYVAGSRASERSAQLIEAFNAALLEAKRDGSYQKIIEKWKARYNVD
jgi:polar amino acid transport system substrate-binding protein